MREAHVQQSLPHTIRASRLPAISRREVILMLRHTLI